MSARCLILLAVGLAAVAAIAGPSKAAEPVTLSRYILTVEGGAASTDADPTILDALCRDEDGCELIMTRTNSPDVEGSATAERTRLFLSLNDNVWFTAAATTGTDDDGNAESAFAVLSGACSFTDGVPGDGEDQEVGFSLLTGFPNQTCRAVLID